MAVLELPHNGWQPRHYQREAWLNWQNGGKRQLLFWHRRAGKDEINLHMHAVGSAQRIGSYWHMLPMAAQARKAIWTAVNPHTGRRRITEAFPAEYIENMNDNEMFIRFKSGSTFQVVGSDNFNSLVGSPPIGITFSEWALANPSAWAYLSPILAENGGWASFITTPRGNNHAKSMLDKFKGNPKWFTQVLTADQTGSISKEAIEDQRQEYEALFGKEMADMLVEQEFYCSFAGALIGSYWGADLNRAEVEGRIKIVPIIEGLPVHTAWDLGAPANNPIWCFQVVGDLIHIVDFYRPTGEDLEAWCNWLNERGYNGTDYVPHDIFHQSWGSQRTRVQMMQDFGRKPHPVTKVTVADGITAGRETIKIAKFHDGEDERGKRVQDGVSGLKSYRREWDDDFKRFRDSPVKDWAEHIGSAFRYLGLSWQEIRKDKPKPPPSPPLFQANNLGGIKSGVTMDQLWKAQRPKDHRI